MATDNKPLPFQGLSDHDAFSLEPQFAANVRNVRSLRERIVRSPGGSLFAPTPIPNSGDPGFGVRVGTFIKNGGTGNQTITHNLNKAPVAIILWMTGASAPGIGQAFHMGVGWTDGTTSLCTSCSSPADGVNASGRRIDNVFFEIIDTTPSVNVLASAAFVSMSATTFVMNWTVNDGSAYEVSYMIVGAAGMLAKALSYTGSGGSGNQAVTGVGFIPDLVLRMGVDAAAGSGSFFSGGGIQLGAMDKNGGQWAQGFGGGGFAATAQSYGIAGFSLAGLLQGQGFRYQDQFVSMDADGFTVKHVVPGGGNSLGLVYCLALKGFANIKCGSVARTTASAPVRQAVTGVGFKPVGLLALTGGDTQAVQGVNSFVSIGGADTSNNVAHALWSSGISGSSISDYEPAVLLDLAMPPTDKQKNVVASLFSFDTDGFTLAYNATNTSNRSIQYIAMSFASSTGGLIGIPRNYPEVYVGPAGPAVDKDLLLTHLSAFIYQPLTPSTGIFNPTSEVYTGTQTQRFSIANTQGIAAWSQGVDNIRQWDGTTFSNLVTSGQNHAARALLAFADRIVSVRPFFGGVDHPTQIRWPINGNVNDWAGTGSGALEIIETSQDPLVTGFVLGDRAFLGKRRELIELIWTGTLSPVFGTLSRVRGMGVLAPHSVGLGEQVAFWLGPDDVYMFDGSTLTPVGERVYNTITALIDYNNLDQIQGVVYTPDSQYWVVVPPYIFIYDYRRDIWDWDDVQNFAAIGIYQVGVNFTAKINKSQFIVVGDPSCQTTRVDYAANSWLGAPIDSYFETRDYTAAEISAKQGALGRFQVNLWDLNSLREIRFQAPPGNIVETGISLDRGASWQTTSVTVNQFGVGVAWFQQPFSQIRFRFRDFGTDSYEIHGSWAFDVETAGYQYP